MTTHATGVGDSSVGAGEVRLARDISRVLAPKTVLDISGSEAFANELRACGADVVLFDGAQNTVRASSRFDLITCVPGPLRFSFDSMEEIRRFSDRILFIPPPDGDTPVVAWLTNFSAYGFAPDPEFDPGPLGSSVVLLRRGPVWPPDALRVFVGWMNLRNPAQRLDRIEMEQRRIAASVRTRPVGGAHIALGVDLVPPRQPEIQPANAVVAELTRRIEALEPALAELTKRIKALEPSVSELERAYDGVKWQVREILQSRTWKILTSIGAVPLRILGRKN